VVFEQWRVRSQAPRRGLRTRVEVIVTLVVAVVVGALIVLPQVLRGSGTNDVLRTQAGPTTTTTAGPTTNAAPPAVSRGDQSAPEQPPATAPPDTSPAPPTAAAPVVTPTPSPTPTPTPTPSASPSAGANPTGSSHATPPTTRRVTTTTAPPVCHNSTDPRCGQFSWDPDPGPNGAMSAKLEVVSDNVQVGEPVSFRISATDPDAAVDGVPNCAATFGEDGERGPCRSQPSCPTNSQYGPWSPPPRQAGSYSGEVTHTYSAPGFYTVTVYVNANGVCGHNPYRSQAEASTSITVSP